MIILEKIPDKFEMTELVGKKLYDVWQKLCDAIDNKYDMECQWNSGGKAWKYEYKYRRGGKTLCALYAKENCIGLMVIFGRDERDRFEEIRQSLSEQICSTFDNATTYHDGKWVMFEPTDDYLISEYIKVLSVKRKPNRKK